MTPVVFATIRQQLGQTRVQFARGLGYTGNDNTCHHQIWQMEQGAKPITPAKSRLAAALLAAAEPTAKNAP